MRKFLTLAFSVLVSFGVASPVLAHSKMAKSNPAEGATVKPGLAEITLGFTKSVRVVLVKVQNMTSNGEVKNGLEPQSSFARALSFPVAPLDSGQHAITWTAVATDGHVMKGTLKFSVKD